MDQVIEKLQNADTIMEVTDLCKFFKAGKKQVLKAVDHVTVSIKRGETLGLVGESGCGKTTCGRTMMKLYEPTSGKVVFTARTSPPSRARICWSSARTSRSSSRIHTLPWTPA